MRGSGVRLPLVVALLVATLVIPIPTLAEQAAAQAAAAVHVSPSGHTPLLGAADRQPQANPTTSHRWQSPTGVHYPAGYAAAKARATRRYQSHHPGVPEPDAGNPGEPNPGANSGNPATSSPGPKAVVFNGLNQPGLDAINSSPSDSTGAIGPNDYIEMVNSRIRLYKRNLTTIQATASLGGFIGFSSDDVFDPQIQWDQEGQRFLFVMDDIDFAGGQFLAVGWSKTSNPANLSSDWCSFSIDTGNEFADYPKLGHDDNHILVGVNVFDPQNYVTSRIYSIPKPANGDTSCANPGSASFWGQAGTPLLTADGDTASTPVPVNTWGASSNGYVIAADEPATGDSELMIWHVSGPPGTPTLTQDTEVAVSAYDLPTNIPQPGTVRVLDSLDARLTQAVAAPDPDAAGALAIWTQHTIDGPGGRAQVRWYEVIPGAVTPLRQEGNVANADHFVFNGAISPTINGNEAVIQYNVGSDTLTAEIRAQSRVSVTALGTMEGEITLGTSNGIDQDFTCDDSPHICRWGDYSGASPDPNNASVVWGTNMANGIFNAQQNDPHWITRNFAISTVLPSGDNTPPTVGTPVRNLFAPQTLGATVVLNVSWPAASDASGIDHYDLEEQTGSGAFVPVTLSSPTATSADVPVTPGTLYAFRVRATDGANNTGSFATTTSTAVSLRQEKNSSITYTSGWTRVSQGSSSGGFVKKATAQNKMATLTFTGRSAALVSTLGAGRGVLRVRVDGGSYVSIDLYAASLQTKAVVWAVQDLGGGTHTINVLVSGTKNPSSTGTRVDIDAFLVQP